MMYYNRKQLESFGEPIGSSHDNVHGRHRKYYGGGKGGADAPDYTPLAQASEKAAQIAADLGEKQLAENQRQYDNNIAIAAPVVQSQVNLSNQQIAQGNDYYNYMKQNSRPVEQSLYYESMGFTPEEIAQIEASRTREITAFNEKANTPVPVSYQVPTYSMAQDIPTGAVKGSEVGSYTIKNTAPKPTSGNLADIASWKPTVSVKADPDSYYIKNADGTYKQVTVGQKVIEGTKTVNQNVAQDTSKLLQETPETDALQAQLAATASERLKAADATERQKITNLNTNLATRIGESDVDVYLRNKDSIDAETAQAVADARAGFTNTANTVMRQGLRYGFSPAKLAAASATTGTDQATKQAAAATSTRKAATQTMYDRGVGESGQLLTGGVTDRNNKIQDTSLATAKKLDVAGLYRNLPGASQGAYNTSIAAGNSAVANNAQAGNSLTNANQGAANTILSGQQLKLNGLGNIVNSQTSAYNNQGDDSAIWGALGSVAGAAIVASDKKVKKNIKNVSDDKNLEGIKNLKITKWKYDSKKIAGQDDKEHVGAMAQDLNKNLGNSVSDGKLVDLISATGITMSAVKALANKVDKLEGNKNGKKG